MKKTSISLFRINGADKDRQGWTQESSQRDQMEQHFPALWDRVSDYHRGDLVPCGFDISFSSNTGGERGIRTPDTRKGIHAFEARAFSHSAISPRR